MALHLSGSTVTSLAGSFVAKTDAELVIPSSATSGDASATFTSTIAAAAARGIRKVRVPFGSYAVKNVYLDQDNVQLVCEPGVTFTWPGAQTSGGSCFILARAGDTTGFVKKSGILGGPFTFDFTGQSVGNQIRGVSILNGQDFEFGHVYGQSIPDQCALYFAKNGASGQMPTRGRVASVYTFNGAQGYGSIQIAAGTDIEFGTLYNDTGGVPLRIENDGFGPGDATDIRVREVIAINCGNGITLSAHAQNIKRITVGMLRMSGCATHESVFEMSTGSISDIRIDGGVIEDCVVNSGQTALIGPNAGDPRTTGVVLNNITMRRITGNAFMVQGYALSNCKVEDASGYGFTDLAPANLGSYAMVATLTDCKAIRCATGSVSGEKSGFWFAAHTAVRLIDPVAYDDTGDTVTATLTVPNGTFDTDATNWTAGNATIAQQTSVKRTGAGALQVTTTGTSSVVVRGNNGLSAIAVSPNLFYTAEAWYKSAAEGMDGQLQFEWWNAAGTSLGQVFGPLVPFDSFAWQRISTTLQAPATAAFVTIRTLGVNPVASGKVYYIDDVALWQTTALPKQTYGAASGNFTKLSVVGARFIGNTIARTKGTTTSLIAEVAPAEPAAPSIGSRLTTTAPAAGGAGALPATPLGYVSVMVAGVERKVAYY